MKETIIDYGSETVEIEATPELGFKDGKLYQLKKVTKRPKNKVFYTPSVSYRWELVGNIGECYPIEENE